MEQKSRPKRKSGARQIAIALADVLAFRYCAHAGHNNNKAGSVASGNAQ